MCELKSLSFSVISSREASHPHGCVSWNSDFKEIDTFSDCHTLTGVWVEIWIVYMSTPLRRSVTPSRVCELKWFWSWVLFFLLWSHPHGCVSWNHPKTWCLPSFPAVTPSRVCELKSPVRRAVSLEIMSHPHGCVSWNHYGAAPFLWYVSSTLTGVWVEISALPDFSTRHASHPHGCVSWNFKIRKHIINGGGHTLTGVWVEIILLRIKWV